MYVSQKPRKSAIGRGGDPYGDLARLLPDTRIVVVSCMGTFVPYEVLSAPEQREDGKWQVRLRHLLAGEIPGYDRWIKQENHGFHGLANLGMMPHDGWPPTWSQSDFTFELSDFVEFCLTGYIGLRQGLDSSSYRFLAERLKIILKM